MDMTDATSWWIVSGVLVAVELATGTFYLLMLALGAAAAAVTAHLGFGGAAQMVAAAIVGGSAVGLQYLKRRQNQPTRQSVSANPDVNIDIGQTVMVQQWSSDGHATVRYRGADWQAQYQGTEQRAGDAASAPPAPGRYTIRAVEGSTLVLDR